MSYPNQLVFTQFHPVAYMVKLNIEMSMASLIAQLAKTQTTDFSGHSNSRDPHSHGTLGSSNREDNMDPESRRGTSPEPRHSDEELRKIQGGAAGIHRKYEVEIRIDKPKSIPSSERLSDHKSSDSRFCEVSDEVALTHDVDYRQPPSAPGTTWDATIMSGNSRAGRERMNNEGSPRK